MAFTSSFSSIPFPLSRMDIYAPSRGKKSISILLALAAILLSITSAIAASIEYPIALVDSIRIGAKGGTSL